MRKLSHHIAKLALVRRLAIVGMPALLMLGACQSTPTTEVLGSAATAVKAQSTHTYPLEGIVAPFLENAFRYRPLIEVEDGGAFMRVPYDELVDINKRDEVPVRKVRSWYVRKLPAGAETSGTFSSGSVTQSYRAVGKLDGGSKFTLIYLHGRGGNKDWGFDDERFGGNFNRLKNMVIKSDGAYISPDFTDFDAQGFAEVKALIARFKPLTSGPLIVSCGSLGNTHCWNIMQDDKTSRQVDGIVMLAGFPDERFFSSPAAKSAARHIPLVIGHGSSDPDYSYEPTLAFYKRLKKATPSYPVRYLLFDTGTHGAPVRMIDWRDTINWIASR